MHPATLHKPGCFPDAGCWDRDLTSIWLAHFQASQLRTTFQAIIAGCRTLGSSLQSPNRPFVSPAGSAPQDTAGGNGRTWPPSTIGQRRNGLWLIQSIRAIAVPKQIAPDQVSGNAAPANGFAMSNALSWDACPARLIAAGSADHRDRLEPLAPYPLRGRKADHRRRAVHRHRPTHWL